MGDEIKKKKKKKSTKKSECECVYLVNLQQFRLVRQHGSSGATERLLLQTKHDIMQITLRAHIILEQ